MEVEEQLEWKPSWKNNFSRDNERDPDTGIQERDSHRRN